MRSVAAESTSEWMDAMRGVPEAKVKETIAGLLTEPSKKDWGGESDDHFSANVSVRGQRRTAAFVLKGPSRFRELTLDMCVVQHAHPIGATVRRTVRTEVIRPSGSR